MTGFFTGVGIVILLQSLLVFARIIMGPTVMDRIVAVNIIGTKAAVLIVIAGIIFNELDMFVDVAIAYAFLNFIASIAASRYFRHYESVHVKEPVVSTPKEAA